MKKINWVFDPAHTEIQFKVKHMMIATVTGNFNEFSGLVETEGEDFENAIIDFKINPSSIDTSNEQRDIHLKSVDFFDVENFPEIKFSTKNFKKSEDNQYLLTGSLTIKNISKDVKLDVEFGGTGKDPWGNIKAGFSLSGKINRSDWGLNWNAVLETGGILVSDEVKILCEVQLVKQ